MFVIYVNGDSRKKKNGIHVSRRALGTQASSCCSIAIAMARPLTLAMSPEGVIGKESGRGRAYRSRSAKPRAGSP